MVDAQPPPPGKSGSNTGRLTVATSHIQNLGTQQECGQTLVHHNATNAATKHTTQDRHLKIVRKTARSKNTKEHAVGCEYIYNAGNGGQLTV
jgi:hypothetical protein